MLVEIRNFQIHFMNKDWSRARLALHELRKLRDGPKTALGGSDTGLAQHRTERTIAESPREKRTLALAGQDQPLYRLARHPFLIGGRGVAFEFA